MDKKARFPEYTTAASEAPVAFVETTRVIRESIPVAPGGTQSFGQFIDQLIAEAVANGQVFQNINLTFTQEQWDEIAR